MASRFREMKRPVAVAEEDGVDEEDEKAHRNP